MQRANGARHPYKDIINLDSDEQQPPTQPPPPLPSNSRPHPSPSLSHTLPRFQQSTNNNPKYQDICNFKSIQWTSSLEKHFIDLKKFLQNTNFNILFIFGPSGCGKTLLVETALNLNYISYQYAVPQQHQNEDSEITYQDIFSMVDQAINEKQTRVLLFKEFPLASAECGSDYLSKYKIFRENIYSQLSRSERRNKTIFILNSQIYSPFHVLSQNSQSKAFTSLKNISVIKMEPYGLRQMKNIIQHFITHNHIYSSTVNTSNDLDEVITQANGDARKALHLIYHRKVRQIAKDFSIYDNWNSQSLSFGRKRDKTVNQLKQDQKVNVFHMLGKFLYGKRKKPTNPHLSTKKSDKQISAYYTEQQLARQDPPFYFKPVQLFDRSQMTLPVFNELLYQNFINRYGKIKDIAKMQQIFVFYDSYLSNSLNKFELMKEMHQIMKELHTWGILIYNRNTVRDGRFYRMQRSKNNAMKQLISKKINIVKSYYTQTPEGGRYRLKDILSFAALTKTSRYKLEHPPLHQKLIELLKDVRKQTYQSQIDHQLAVIQEEQENVQQSGSRINMIEQAIISQLNKRQNFMALMDESDESDIDSQN